MSERAKYVGPGGIVSPRDYTDEEWAAARREGFAHETYGRGAIFWGTWTRPEVESRLRAAERKAADCRLLLAAIEREYPKPWPT